MYAQYPPGLESPLLYLTVVFFMLLGLLLAAEWLWRLVWSFFERPQPLKSPATVVRVILVLLLTSIMIPAAPRLWLFMRWPLLTLAQREAAQTLTAQVLIFAIVLFVLAWFVALVVDPMIKYQLEKTPPPVHLWPTVEQLKRPLKIGGGVLVIAFALTYLR
jgi:hypothetical protein